MAVCNKGQLSQSFHHMGAADCDVTGSCEVKQTCRDQRAALPGEPTCCVCGCYGEYVCDETDGDVCSLECKQIHLGRIAASDGQLPERTFAVDECFYVGDSRDGLDLPGSRTARSRTEVLRKKLGISVKGGDVEEAPISSFSSCDVPQKLLQNLELAGYDAPTPVQMQAIPAALSGRSLLVSAHTGSGKTASFLIPVVSRCARFRLQQSSDSKLPLAVVLTPTRELCMQVEAQAKLLGKGLPFKTALVIGGDAMAGQLHRISRGAELIVATPGRLVDLLAKHDDVDLSDVMAFVVDEVDCMLRRGFRDQVLQIYRALSRPQILMFSATMPREVQTMASCFGKDEVALVSVGRPNMPSEAVKQIAIWVESRRKKQKLFDILQSKRHFMPPVVVFVGSRVGADLLAHAITVTTGLRARSVHGEKAMTERREIAESFSSGEVAVLVTTGILGRGVDLAGVRQVVVFDMPNSVKEYVHQIGRASRMGADGVAMLFINEESRGLFPELVRVLRASGAAVPPKLANSQCLALPSSPTIADCRSQRKRKPDL